MRRIFAIATLFMATLMPVQANAANTWGTDFSDLWWNSRESGWGANIAHQREVIFMTLFVYGDDQRTRWYVAPATTYLSGSSGTFFGTLYEMSGPFLGDGVFNPQAVGIRSVGDVTLRFDTAQVGSLSYSVDGVAVEKTIERQTFRENNLSGTYLGAEIGSSTGCTTGSGAFENKAALTINHSGDNVSILSTLSDTLSCTYAGIYAQSGRMGQIQGTVSCTNGARGAFSALEVEAGYLGFLAGYIIDYGSGCIETGRIGGMKRD
jgi:hypothetical protein